MLRAIPSPLESAAKAVSSQVPKTSVCSRTLGESLRLAADYTADCIRITAEDPNGIRYGVYFETLIPELLKKLGKR